jgi:hypothetical protein
MNRTVIIAVLLAVIVAVGALVFVSSRPTVPDGGGADTSVGDTSPGNPDGGSGG